MDLPTIPELGMIQKEENTAIPGYKKTAPFVQIGRTITRKHAFYLFACYVFAGLFLGMGFTTMWLNGIPFLVKIFITIIVIIIGMGICNTQPTLEFHHDYIKIHSTDSFLQRIQYFVSVLCNIENHIDRKYTYQEIELVELKLVERYINNPYGRIAIPEKMYMVDLNIVTKDGRQYPFIAPEFYENDAQFIATILEKNVENIIDSDEVLPILKTGQNLTEYIKKYRS